MMRTTTLSPPILRHARSLVPGLALALAITGLALFGEQIEIRIFGRAWLEALVLAIIFGVLWRSLAPPAPRFAAGIAFSGKILLEIAVVLLGASVSASAVAAAGAGLILGIAGIVVISIGVSYGLGRAFGLRHRLAVLVACGNSICGNSAIAAIAPAIGADSKEIAAAIAFTAVLGVGVVLALPNLVPLLGFSLTQYGIFAGLTVYAVPQVIAATAPVGPLSVQLGTLVKLVRVLMLGPVVLGFSLAGRNTSMANPKLHHMVPWFIIGFLTMMGLRSFDLIPQAILAPISTVSIWLTIVSMAALGLGVDVRSVGSAGGRVIATASVSLMALGGLAFGLITLLHVV